jgi:hypothetical protein
MERRRRCGGRLTAAALVGLLACLGSAAQAQAATGVVPKGTPYAAEVNLRVTASLDYSVDESGGIRAACGGGTGDLTSTEAGRWSEDWDVRYPHITVPLATREDLGKAYHRLHVQVTPTSDGTGGLSGSYSISGRGMPESEFNCDLQDYGGAGALTSNGDPTFEQKPQADGTDNFILDFAPGGLFGDPESYDDFNGDPRDPADELGQYQIRAHDLNPDTDVTSGTGINFSDDLDSAFKTLVHHPDLVKTLFDTAVGLDCGTYDDGTAYNSCSYSQTGSAAYAMHRLFLYRTKRAYPK